MQPYFFPYLGYFQLISVSDIIILHDDVQYIKGGWVNRNRIRMQGTPRTITLPVLRGSHKLTILERRYSDLRGNSARLLRRIREAYREAPHRAETCEVLEEILSCPFDNVATFNTNLIRQMLERLGISTPLVIASELNKDDHLKGQERVLDLCRLVGAQRYLNLPGGRGLYQPEAFTARGMELRFLDPLPCRRRHQVGPTYSVIDDLMHLDAQQLRNSLADFAILP